MQKNWYVLYTKADCEKKVALQLSKKKIDNFYPLVLTKTNFLRRIKIQSEPLLRSHVFVYISYKEMESVKQIYGVINFLFWRGTPAVITDEEVLIIKEFCNDYNDIKATKIAVDMNDLARIIDSPAYYTEGKILAVKNRSVKAYLPSLGYILVASLKEDTIFGKEATIIQSNSFSHS
jgi:transcription antitermination factor NusG